MGLGNDNPNVGNKGSNYKYQYGVLSLLTKILTALGGGIGVVRTPSLARVTGAGTVAAGAESVTVYNAGVANGLVLGGAIKPGESFTWSVSTGDSLAAIAYDGTGTELVITKLV